MKAFLGLLLLTATYVSGQSVSEPEPTPATICPLMVTGTYIADPSSCTTYYQCSNGNAIQMTCSSGLQYNKDLQSCVAPASSTCGQTSSVNTACAGQAEGTFISDSSTCSGYYYCDGSSSGTHGNCPTGESFNPTTQACVYASTYTCSSSASGSGEATTDENALCNYVPSGVYFGVATSCAAWAVCKNGFYNTGTCPSGETFDTANGMCDYSVAVGGSCEQLNGDNVGQSTPSASTPAPSVAGLCTASGFLSDKLTCVGYYYCSGSGASGQWGQCENNLFFDPTTSTCVTRSSYLCTQGNICANTANTNYKWVNDPTNCQNYYYCNNNVASVQAYSCPTGYYFNQEQQVCTSTMPTYAACAGSSASSSSTSASDSSAESSSTTADASSTTDASTTTTTA